MVAYRDTLITQGSSGSQADGTLHFNAVLETANATVTKIVGIPLAVLEAGVVEALVIGFKTDATAGIFRHICGGFRRAAAGNVTSIGTATGTDVEDSAAAPAVTIAANTTTQEIELRVAGVAAETYRWEAHVSFTKIR